MFTRGIGAVVLGAAANVLEMFHSRPPFARRGRDSSLPGQRKSHGSHSWLLRYRRPPRPERQASGLLALVATSHLFSLSSCGSTIRYKNVARTASLDRLFP